MATIDDAILAASLIPPSHGPPGLLTLPLNLLSRMLTYVSCVAFSVSRDKIVTVTDHLLGFDR